MLEPLSDNGLLYLMAIARKKEIKKAVSLYVSTLRNIQPMLNGEDLKRLGYAPGKEFREMFSALRNARLDSMLESQKDEEEFILNNFPH